MNSLRILLLGVLSVVAVQAAEPLKALLITGGCCHDYAKQKLIISQGVSKRANVDWTILHEGGAGRTHKFAIYQKKDWIKDYDVVVHNECFGAIGDKAFVEGIAAAHGNSGVPAVVLHCTMHSYRAADKITDEWRKLLGVTTVRHQQHVAVTIENIQPKHPIMQGFGKSWTPANCTRSSRSGRTPPCLGMPTACVPRRIIPASGPTVTAKPACLAPPSGTTIKLWRAKPI